MKKIYNRLILLLLLLFPMLSGAQSFVYLNDTAFLSLDGIAYGDIQWQQSDDTVSWVNISGATTNMHPIVPSLTRYYRAKVTSSSCNPFYSDMFKIYVIPFQCGDTLIDYRDRKKYPTVQIGSQCWMARNLDVGVMLTNGTQTQADNGIIEKYCYNNDTNNCKIYGGLYTWNEMMTYAEIESSRGICPCGWHIPSDQEWIDLEIILGMPSATAALYNTWRGTDEGTKLKVGGSSGYNALLSGNAIPGGMFSAINNYEYMQASTPYGTYNWRRCVRTGDPTVGRWNTFPKSYGLSVRCIKNQ